MKIIKNFLISVLALIILVGSVAVGGYFYVKKTYDIDLLKTVKELKILSEPVNESELCPHAFTDSDMLDVQTEVNNSVENFITYSEQHGYAVNFDDLPDQMKYIIRLTDKQVGALAQTIINQETGGKIAIAGKEVDLAVKQVQFSSITTTSALVNVIVSIDLTPFIGDMPEKFPFTYLKKHIPSGLYISSTVKIDKGEPFTYTVSHQALTINKLSKEDTEDLFHTLDVVLKVGSAKDWNVKIGTAIANALIGNEVDNGLAYSLKGIGATDYKFFKEAGVNYFSVLR